MNEQDKSNYFRQERREVEDVIPDSADRILDVGCGEGILGRSLLNKGAKEVTGIELSREVCDRAKDNLTNVICGDIEELNPEFEKEYFDCIIFADILEHTKDPLAVLEKFGEYLSDAGCIVASIPNVGYYGVIDMLSQGHWTYGDHGILDRTHVRFFARKEIETLFSNAGLEITGITYNMNPVYENLEDPCSGNISFGRIELSGLTPEEVRDLFVFQYIIRAQKDGHEKKQVKKDVEESIRSSNTEMQDSGKIEKNNNQKAKKIAIVRGANLNKWEMQNYESLQQEYDLTAYTTNQTMFDISKIDLPLVQLPYTGQGLLMEMVGLEDGLADKDLVFSADITYKFSAQAVLAKQQSGCRVVCLEWENIPFNYEEYEEVYHIKETVRNGADHFIAVTERAKEALMIEGINEEKIDVIPMGVDLNVFRPVNDNLYEERSKLGIESDDLVVLFIGRMVWEKGIYDFLHAAGRVCRDEMLQKKHIKYVIVGKGPELEGARERASALGISHATIFLEEYPYKEMYILHNIADLFVLPSISTRTWQEQFGMVLIESMACGTPVISTYSGSIPEVVGDGGMLVQPNDHLSLYNAMKEMISNEDHRTDQGKKALNRAARLFDSTKIADKVKAVFNKVMSRKTKEELLQVIHDESNELWQQGEKTKAFSMVCEIFGRDPDNGNVLETIFSMGMELEKYEIVEQSITEYLKCHPANLEALALLAEVLIYLGQIEQARTELKKILIFDSQHERANLLLNQIKEKKNSVKQMS